VLPGRTGSKNGSPEQVRRAGVVGAGRWRLPHPREARQKSGDRDRQRCGMRTLLHKDAAVMDHRLRRGRRPRSRPGSDGSLPGDRRPQSQANAGRRCAPAASGGRRSTPAARRLLSGRRRVRPRLHGYRRQVSAGRHSARVGVVVCNVETLANVASAAEGQPVTRKTITLAGAVKSPRRSRFRSAQHSRRASALPGASRRRVPCSSWVA